jgi:hypothetical protein
MGAAALVALLLVPLALRGHQHADQSAAARPCAVCLATAHTPAVAGPLTAEVAPSIVHTPAVPTDVLVLASCERRTHAGRAPPAAGVGQAT